MTEVGRPPSPTVGAVAAVLPAVLQLSMLFGSWWPAAALADVLPNLAGITGWRVTGLAPPLVLWIGWRGTDAPRARRSRPWMYVLQRGSTVAHVLFLGGGFGALAAGATPDVPWSWSVYSALGLAAATAEWRRCARGLDRLLKSDSEGSDDPE